jgi:hypothetical protein
MKLRIDVEIPVGKYCFDRNKPHEECQYLNGQFCNIFRKTNRYWAGKIEKCMDCAEQT